MKLIEVIILFTLLILFTNLCTTISIQIFEYRSDSLYYLQKTKDLLQAHVDLINNNEEGVYESKNNP